MWILPFLKDGNEKTLSKRRFAIFGRSATAVQSICVEVIGKSSKLRMVTNICIRFLVHFETSRNFSCFSYFVYAANVRMHRRMPKPKHHVLYYWLQFGIKKSFMFDCFRIQNEILYARTSFVNSNFSLFVILPSQAEVSSA